jgi:hypothetical protein
MPAAVRHPLHNLWDRQLDHLDMASAATPSRDYALLAKLGALPGDTLLTTREAATMLGYSPETLRKWRDQGRGPKWRPVSARPRYELREHRLASAQSLRARLVRNLRNGISRRSGL